MLLFYRMPINAPPNLLKLERFLIPHLQTLLLSSFPLEKCLELAAVAARRKWSLRIEYMIAFRSPTSMNHF